MPDFPAVTQLAIPFFIAAILVEMLAVKFGWGRGEFEMKDTFASLAMGVGNVVMGIVFGFISYGILIWFWQFRFFDLGFHWWVGVIAFLLDDLRYYWYHR
ncbi:MAG: sterol desaturase family protein, partial [Nitratireductor sp.]|nr:sterol desaturase family protein [Nitratireductor sp.]